MAFVRAEGVPVSVFRPFSGYGTDQDLDYPFPSIIARAVAGADPFPIWADTVRDLIHIDDVVSAVLEVAGSGGSAEPLNLCTGVPTSFSELASMAMAEAGYKAPVEVLNGPSGSHTRVGDPARMLTVYTPRIELAEGVARAVAGVR
jgi:GDP-L-fucose synthase